MTKLPDHPQSQAEYQHLQQTCDVISREIGKLEAETGVGAEEKRVVSVPQDATMDDLWSEPPADEPVVDLTGADDARAQVLHAALDRTPIPFPG